MSSWIPPPPQSRHIQFIQQEKSMITDQMQIVFSLTFLRWAFFMTWNLIQQISRQNQSLLRSQGCIMNTFSCSSEYQVRFLPGVISHADVIQWEHFPRYWPFVRGIHRSPVNSPHKGQWRGALIFSLICAWINGWINNREAGDLRSHCAHCDVTIMSYPPFNGCNLS